MYSNAPPNPFIQTPSHSTINQRSCSHLRASHANCASARNILPPRMPRVLLVFSCRLREILARLSCLSCLVPIARLYKYALALMLSCSHRSSGPMAVALRGPAHLRACGHCTLGSVGIALPGLEPSYCEAYGDPNSRPIAIER